MIILTTRQKKIAQYLLNESQVFTAKSLADYFKVSTRTIRNDLDKVSEWINTNDGCVYHSQPGKGVWISFASDYSQKHAINNLILQTSIHKKYQYYSSEDRKWRLISGLIFANKYLTGKELIQKINVSSNTFLSDLQNVKDTLKFFNLKINSKKYYGYSIVGEEIDIRDLMEFIIHQRIDTYSISSNKIIEILSLISFKATKDDSLSDEIRKYINKVSLILINFLSKYKKNNNVKNLEILKSIISRLVVIIFRKYHGHELVGNKQLKNYSDESYKQIFNKVLSIFKISPDSKEFRYFILGGRTYSDSVQADELSKKIIEYVSKKLKVSFGKSVKLQDALTQHLMMKININFQYMSEHTPFTDEVKNRYQSLYSAVKLALHTYISYSPVVINDTYITLISLHFLASLNEVKTTSKVKVMYVCSSGLGASNLLQKLIEENIPKIKGIGFASYINYRNRALKLHPDIIISIFPLVNDTKIPIIQVNPIPTDKDIEQIKKVLRHIQTTMLVNNESNSLNLNEYRQTSAFTTQVITLALQAAIQLKQYLGKKIAPKYMDAFIIHTELVTVRIYFQEQYKFSDMGKEIERFNSEDIAFVKTIFKNLNLDINASEIVALLRYTLLD